MDALLAAVVLLADVLVVAAATFPVYVAKVVEGVVWLLTVLDVALAAFAGGTVYSTVWVCHMVMALFFR